VVAACTVTVEVGEGPSKVKVQGVVGGIPKDMQPVGHAKVDLPTGGTVDVGTYDTDHDGKPDTAGPVDGKYYRVDPSTPLKLLTGGGSFSVTAEARNKEPTYMIYAHPIMDPANPLSVQFTETADESIHDYGLDDLDNPNGITAQNAFKVLSAWASDEDPKLPSQVGLDVVLNWNTELGWADIEKFPSLMYEDFGLPDVPNTFPHYAIRHVAGDAGAVFNWLAENGITHVSVQDVSLVGFAHIQQMDIDISQAAGVAVINSDGTLTTIHLGF
jgi:hypothetical protein